MSIQIGQAGLANVFTGNAFSAITLTARINNTPFVPSLLGSIGLFHVDGVPTTDVAVEERNGQLMLVQTSPRGAPGHTTTHAKSNLRKVSTTHLKLVDTVTADQVQNAINSGAVFGQPAMQSAEALVHERFEGAIGLRARMELTHEFHRLGAIKGLVLDADGSVLFDWYDFFGIARPPVAEVDFAGANADELLLEQQCTDLKRAMVRGCAGLPTTTLRGVALCGDNFYDKLRGNKEVAAQRKAANTGRGEGDVFARNAAYDSFVYGGITFVNYQGTDDGLVGIDTNRARLFPLGVPGLFQQLFGPPDIHGMTNMKGLPVHAYLPPEAQTSRSVGLEAQSNPLTMCLRPQALVELKVKGS